MKAVDITNTFTTRKIYEIAEMIAGKPLPPKQSKSVELIIETFPTMKDLYTFLSKKEYREPRYFAIGLGLEKQ